MSKYVQNRQTNTNQTIGKVGAMSIMFMQGEMQMHICSVKNNAHMEFINVDIDCH